MPTDVGASYCSFGKFISADRQTSELNAEVFMTSATIAADIGLIGTPMLGRAKNSSSNRVTSGVARNMLTYRVTIPATIGTFAHRINARPSRIGNPRRMPRRERVTGKVYP